MIKHGIGHLSTESMKDEDGKLNIVLDFDGVIHDFQGEWRGSHIAEGEPVDAVFKFIINAYDTFNIHVFSSRSGDVEGIQTMKDYISKNLRKLVQEDDDYDEYEIDVEGILKSIQYPTKKVPAQLYIDDRAYQFNGSMPDIDEILNYKPWNR